MCTFYCHSVSRLAILQLQGKEEQKKHIIHKSYIYKNNGHICKHSNNKNKHIKQHVDQEVNEKKEVLVSLI